MQLFWSTLYFSLISIAGLSFIAAFIFAISCLIKEKRLKISAIDIEDTSKKIDRFMQWGFSLLTLGMIIGMRYSNEMWGSYWRWNSTDIITLSAWILVLGSMHYRHVLNRKGRKSVIFSVVSLAILFLISIITIFFL